MLPIGRDTLKTKEAQSMRLEIYQSHCFLDICRSCFLVNVWCGLLVNTVIILFDCNVHNVVSWLTGSYFSPGPPVSSNNKTDRHDITEMLV
jgi:hypothetical protein